MAALEKAPTDAELESLIGGSALSLWKRLTSEIDALYEIEHIWGDGGKKWTYEYKYRRGGKTLCALYAKEGRFGFMMIFGRAEREKIAPLRDCLSPHTWELYEQAETYRDGKWVMFDEGLDLSDMRRLLAVKRKPNR